MHGRLVHPICGGCCCMSNTSCDVEAIQCDRPVSASTCAWGCCMSNGSCNIKPSSNRVGIQNPKSEECLPWNVLHCHALVRPRLEHLVRHPLVHVTQNFRQRSGDERIRRFQRDCVACIRDRLYAIHGRGHRDQPPLLRPHSHGRPPLPQP